MENNMSAKQPVLWPLPGRILCTLLDAAKSSALNLFAVFFSDRLESRCAIYTSM